MRNLILILSLIFIFDVSSFTQTSQVQPVKITNFGTATRDEVRGLRRDLKEIVKDLKVGNLENQNKSEKMMTTFDSLNAKLDRSNALLKELQNNRWNFQDVFGTGLLLLLLLGLLLWALGASYLSSPIWLTTTPAPQNLNSQGPPADVEIARDLDLLVGDYAHDQGILANGNSGTMTITVNNYNDHYNYGDVNLITTEEE